MNIVIPCAGEGRRFAEAGYDKPKPLIDVAGKPMIERVIDCLRSSDDDTVTVISRIPLHLPDANVVATGPTEGAADTLLATALSPERVLVANCDQLITTPIETFLSCVQDCDAGVMTFNSTNPHHSYVRVNRTGLVVEIAEKRVISDNAVLGIYWFASGTALQKFALAAIDAGERVNGEVYISSILDQYIKAGRAVGAYEVDVKDKHMLGTPEELRIFLDKVEDGRVVL